MVRDKLRIRFRKTGDLRFVSHHDLMRCFERMLRRADLPFHSTQGFNPRPRLVFAAPLPLGVVGLNEVVDLELDAELPVDDVCRRLREQVPPGLEVVEVTRLTRRRAAQVHRALYRVPLKPDDEAGLPEKIAAALAAPACWVERTRPQARRLDIRPYLDALRLVPGALEMDLRVTPNGTARPDDVLALLGLSPLLEAGTVIERTGLELAEAAAPAGPAPPPDPRPEPQPGGAPC